MSVKKKLLQNGLASAIQKVIKISEQLLLVPFFITTWGAAYYGEWITLTIIPTIIGFSDLGFGTAAANSFVLKYASDDKQGASNIAKSGFLSITFIILLSIVVSILLIFICSYYHLFDKSLIVKQQAILAVSFLMASRIICFYQQLFEAYFRAARRAALSINLQSIYSTVTLTISMIVLLSGGGIVIFALSNLVITVVFNLFYAVVAEKVLPIRKEYKGIIFKSDIKSIVNKGFGYLMSPIWQATFFQGTTFVVRIVLGPEAVAVFNTVRTVTRAINQAYTMIISAIIPELQFEIGAGNMQKARKIFRIALSLIVLIALGGMIILFLGGPWLYELWTRKALNPPALMWNIFIIGIAFNAVWWTTSFIFQVMNKPYGFAVAGVICSILSVIASYFLAIPYGLNGAAIGSLLMDILLFMYILPQSCKLIEQPLGSLIGDSIADCTELWKVQVSKLLKLKLRF
ncbi:MAG: oligosaccharide flippase family protein [Paludibacter sp.]|nr:oligosaccharide flippase family protein [Paludibacter sp.]